MDKRVGFFIHCGAFRPRWLKSNQSRTTLTFSFSVEVPMGEEESVEDDLRESILESLTSWSRSCYVKVKKKEQERKVKRGKV
jgi:hypothetical protein